MTYLRFGIRDLLWTMIVVGLVIGWWIDRQRLDENARYLDWKANQLSNHIRMFAKVEVAEDGDVWIRQAGEPTFVYKFQRNAASK